MDPIANMLNAIKTAGEVGNKVALVPYSNLKFEIVNILAKEGYIHSFSVKGKKATKRLEIEIAYREDGAPRLLGVARISRQSRRVYQKAKELVPVKQGTGISVVSTPRGVLTGKEAKKANVGGEVLFTMW